MTIPTTALPYVRDLTSTAKGFAVRVLDTRLISADAISGDRDSHPNLDIAPFRCVDSPTFSIYTEHIYQLPPFCVWDKQLFASFSYAADLEFQALTHF
jgi:hypothetical protein